METFIPSKSILEKYAKVLVHFGLNNGKGVKKGNKVLILIDSVALPLLYFLEKEILESGGHVIRHINPDSSRQFNFKKMQINSASQKQLEYTPKAVIDAWLNEVDHVLSIRGDTYLDALQGANPTKVMAVQTSARYFSHKLLELEMRGELTWSLGLYGTDSLASEAGMTLKEYWYEIKKGCLLNAVDPVAQWKKTDKALRKISSTLSKMRIKKLHIVGVDVDLWVGIGFDRKWVSGGGSNIPSFECFTSPDFRMTEGWVRFSEPLYRYGNIISGIRLEFKKGKVVSASAKKNEKVLREMIAQKNADKIGEFSLTDSRISKIKKFMATTLYDENVGGKFGNMHIALGAAYRFCYDGDSSKFSESMWKQLGFNKSPIHTDIMTTSDRMVTAYLDDGSEKVIYKKGKFTFLDTI